jgi:hypothetical protein
LKKIGIQNIDCFVVIFSQCTIFASFIFDLTQPV